MRIGVIGSGQVGQALSQGLTKHGYEARIASRSPEKLAEFSKRSGVQTGTPADVAAWAEAVILAVKGDAAEAALREAGARPTRLRPSRLRTASSGSSPRPTTR